MCKLVFVSNFSQRNCKYSKNNCETLPKSFRIQAFVPEEIIAVKLR